MNTDGTAVRAHQVRLDGPRGAVFGPIDLEVPAGRATALVSPAQSGRTSLLLALTGRMAPTAGELVVLGEHLPRHVRRVQQATALANFHGIDTLDEGLRVRELVNERAGLLVPMWRRPAWFGERTASAVFATVYGDDAVPQGDLQIWHLPPVDIARLRVVLALLGRPRLIAVDDVDSLRNPADQVALWSSLDRVADTGATVVAAASSFGAITSHINVVHLEAHA
jgi:ABC-type branched-subunit amino acid transport system ATPase component